MQTVVERTVARRLAGRYENYADEVHRLVEATYRVIERTGSLDPTVREILREAGLSTVAFYRYFRSKDELFATLLEDGRQQMASYLEHRMASARSPAQRVQAWIEGVLAQASNRKAAQRTRPFLANLDRLAARYPREQLAAEQAMVGPLEAALRELGSTDVHRDARAIYLLAVAAMHENIQRERRPAKGETAHLVAFCLKAVGSSRRIRSGPR